MLPVIVAATCVYLGLGFSLAVYMDMHNKRGDTTIGDYLAFTYLWGLIFLALLVILPLEFFEKKVFDKRPWRPNRRH